MANFKYCTVCKNEKAHPNSNSCKNCYNEKTKQENQAWAEYRAPMTRNLRAKMIYLSADTLPKWMREHMDWGE